MHKFAIGKGLTYTQIIIRDDLLLKTILEYLFCLLEYIAEYLLAESNRKNFQKKRLGKG